MKVTNWRKKIIASIVAGGALVPGLGYAVDIPLVDPSFELYVVPANPGYAYAAPPNGSYRPTSPWVDDLDNPPGFTQDNGNSNWIYDAAYAEMDVTPPINRRPAPRTGNQAMHGLDGNFNAQELVTTFQADKTYRFSVWAQNDIALDQGDGLGLYVFNANVPFSIANSLSQANFTTSVSHRTLAMTPAQSSASWSQHTVQHTVFAGDPAVGQPIGVAFRAFRDTAVDDATLTVDDASNFLLALEVNTTNGQVRMRNQTGAAIKIDYYDVKSAAGALNATAWNSLQEQNLPGFPAGNGSGNGWEQAGGSRSVTIGESYLTGNSSGGNAATFGLGAAFNVGGAQDLIFQYGAIVAAGPPPTGDYNNNGVVDGADYVTWRNAGPTDTLPNDSTPGTVNAADYTVWRQQFGASSVGPSTLFRGLVRYVTAFSGGGTAVPEPTSFVLVGLGFATLIVGGRVRT
jgi:hypothetical protein